MNISDYLSRLIPGLMVSFVAVPVMASPEVDAFNQAKRYSLGRHPSKSLPLFAKAIRLKPDFADAYASRAFAYLQMERPHMALEDLNRAISLSGKNPKYYELRARCHFECGSIEKAIVDYSSALSNTENKHMKSDFLRLRAKMHIAQKNDKKALVDLEKANSYRQMPSNFWLRGNVYFRLKMYKNAVEDYTKSIKLDDGSDRSRLYSLRANAYEKMGRKDLAEKDRQTVRRLVKDEFGDFFGY